MSRLRVSQVLLTSLLTLTTTAIAQRPGGRPQPRLALLALDLDKDGTISAEELAKASTSLLTLDKNNDGALSDDEFFPPAEPMPGQGPGQGSEMIAMVMSFDKNHDQVITADELPERMKYLLTRGDKNNDGKLTQDELQEMVRQQKAPAGRAGNRAEMLGRRIKLDPVLAALDANHDGMISADEVKNAAQLLSSLDANHDGQLSGEEIAPRKISVKERADHFFEEWDTNKDGKIAKAEAPDGLQRRFAEVDTDNDGFLSMAEVLAFYERMDSAPAPRP